MLIISEKLSSLHGGFASKMRLSKLSVLCVIDMTLLMVSVRLGQGLFRVNDELNIYAFAGSAVIGVLVLLVIGAYRSIVSTSDVKSEWWRFFVGSASAGLAYYLFSESILLLVIWVAFSGATLLVGIRFAGRLRFLRVRQKTGICIYGAGQAGLELKLLLESTGRKKVHFFLDDNPKIQGRYAGGVPVVSVRLLSDLLERHNIEELVVAIPSISVTERDNLLSRISSLSVEIRMAPNMSEILQGEKISSLRKIGVEDLLGRSSVEADENLLGASVHRKVVMVTGAGGSIGSELCRQIARLRPIKILILDASELSLYEIEREMLATAPSVEVVPVMGNICNKQFVDRALSLHKVNIVFHAAAYKHVPLVEANVLESVRNNILGTLILIESVEQYGVEKFVLISSDKAVRPTNVMGATKRVCELIVQARAEERKGQGLVYSMVRFGNVLESSGSVVPLFQEQIDKGGPITLTHPDITRYFMTIPEAAQLVLQASTLSTNGDVFVLDMGAPIKILELAKLLIHMNGYKVKGESIDRQEIEILISGLRPGEKLYEELIIDDNAQDTQHPKIKKALEVFVKWQYFKEDIVEIKGALALENEEAIRSILMRLAFIA